jgi:chaperonin GroEL
MNIDKTNDNIVNREEYEKTALGVFGRMAEIVSNTLGVAAGDTMIFDYSSQTPLSPSKDGFRNALSIKFSEPVHELIARAIKDVSLKVNIDVGDGTTSVMIVAHELYKRLLEYRNKSRIKLSPYGLNNLLKIIERVIVTNLKKPEFGYIIKPVELDRSRRFEVYDHVATIAANNDETLGKTVSEIYKKHEKESLFINVTRSNTEEDIIDTDTGFEFPAGHIVRHMATESDGITCEYDNPLFLMIDGPLIGNDLPSLQAFIENTAIESGMPLCIMASEYSAEVINYFIQLRSGVERPSGQVIRAPVVAIIVNTGNAIGNERLRDLEAALGAKALPTNNGKLINPPKDHMGLLRLCGRAKKITTMPYFCKIIGAAADQAEVEGRVEEIEKELREKVAIGGDNILAMERAETLKSRIAMLRGEMCIYRVGGKTVKEKESRKYLIEDAVYATKSALKHGVTLAGNVSIPHLVKWRKELLIEAVMDELSKVATNFLLGGEGDRSRRKVIGDVLEIVAKAFESAYQMALYNAVLDWTKVKDLYRVLLDKEAGPENYNLLTGERKTLDKFDLPELLAPGNVDIAILNATFGVVGTFITSTQLMTWFVTNTEKKA